MCDTYGTTIRDDTADCDISDLARWELAAVLRRLLDAVGVPAALLDPADLDHGCNLLACATPAPQVVRRLAAVASDNAVVLAIFHGAALRRRGEDGGDVYVYDRHRRDPGHRWVLETQRGYAFAERTDHLPFDEAEPVGFDLAALKYCPTCETRFGCAHNHGDGVEFTRPGVPLAAA